jgi:hypothetical protein
MLDTVAENMWRFITLMHPIESALFNKLKKKKEKKEKNINY